MSNYNPDDKAFLQKLGAAIRVLRNAKGVSQEQLAFDADLDRTYIGSVERGERNISMLNFRKIAVALDAKLSEIIDKSNEPDF